LGHDSTRKRRDSITAAASYRSVRVHQNDDAGSDDGQQDGDYQQQVGGRADIS
jgi:hypothetical protein